MTSWGTGCVGEAATATKVGEAALGAWRSEKLGHSVVHPLLPGVTDTSSFRAINNTEDTRAFVSGLHAPKRIARPGELARSALYLASDASILTTGNGPAVDGRVSINRT